LTPEEAIIRASALVRNTHQTFDTAEARRIMEALLEAIRRRKIQVAWDRQAHLFKNLNATSGILGGELHNPLVPK